MTFPFPFTLCKGSLQIYILSDINLHLLEMYAFFLSSFLGERDNASRNYAIAHYLKENKVPDHTIFMNYCFNM